ncbi:MAG: hypothetical protein KDB26_11150 [Microthrixaceae bacterium]|nr:hypothetical protein [Microthrixaceae bacterium]
MASPGAAHATLAEKAPHAYDNLAARSATAADDEPAAGADQVAREAEVDVNGKLHNYDERSSVACTSAGAERHVARGPPSDKVLGTSDAITSSADPAGKPGCVCRALQSPGAGLVTPHAVGAADDLVRQGRQVTGRFPRNAAPDEVLVRRGADGSVSHYQVYGPDGLPVLRVDVTGRSHGGVPTRPTSSSSSGT